MLGVDIVRTRPEVMSSVPFGKASVSLPESVTCCCFVVLRKGRSHNCGAGNPVLWLKACIRRHIIATIGQLPHHPQLSSIQTIPSKLHYGSSLDWLQDMLKSI